MRWTRSLMLSSFSMNDGLFFLVLSVQPMPQQKRASWPHAKTPVLSTAFNNRPMFASSFMPYSPRYWNIFSTVLGCSTYWRKSLKEMRCCTRISENVALNEEWAKSLPSYISGYYWRPVAPFL
jgi:hypothetical protein